MHTYAYVHTIITVLLFILIITDAACVVRHCVTSLSSLYHCPPPRTHVSARKTATNMTVNPDLEAERARATFDTERVTNLIDGGADKTRRRRQLEALIARDPTGVFSNEDNPYLHRKERHVRALAKHVRLIELCRMHGIGSEPEANGEVTLSPDFAHLLAGLADDPPTALHWVMFVPNIRTLADDEQQAKWLPLCRDWKMIGCYAQTELGHGSNVRALETTATFVPESKGGDRGGSWIIDSPTLTASKFWPGTLGRTSNHAMVIARLIDGVGKDRGMHNFLVPLRSMEDHKLLPGVITGDIGPKIGLNNMDNGFARFDKVKIPRRNMAMRFANVDKHGKYSKKTVDDATSKVSYVTMMQVRALIVNEAGKNLAIACTISVRYSAVRRQGFDESNRKEIQILDYRQQQHRLFPHIAESYCFHFTGKKVLEHLYAIEHRLVSGAGDVLKTEVADIHASTSALKSFTTFVAADGIEDCRKACGGHGFLQYSGLPELATTYLQNPTVEGDNHMLPQQVVKVLLKLVQAVQSDDEEAISQYRRCDSRYLIPSLRSIITGKDAERCTAVRESDMMNLEILLAAYRHRSARLLFEVAVQIQKAASEGKSMQEAWNDALIQMARVSKAHAAFLLLENFSTSVKEEGLSSETLSPKEVAVFSDLARLFGLYWMERDVGDFLEDGFLSAKQAAWVRSGVLKMLDTIRPNAVALVDARDISDFRLKSALGRYDGNVYPAIMAGAEKSSLNQSDPGPGYEEHLKKLIVGGVGVFSGTQSRL